MAAINYQIVDASKLGAPGPGPTRLPIVGYTTWAINTVYGAGAKVQNGAFLFSTVAGGTSAASGNGPSPQYLTDNSVTWVLVGGVSNLTVSDATQQMDLGTTLTGSDPTYGVGEFIYVKLTGSTAIVAGDAVIINRAAMTAVQAASGATGTSRGLCGLAMGSHALNVATPTYGWVMLRGVHSHANIITGTSVDVGLHISATAGRLGLSPVSTYSTPGFVGRVANAANNVGMCELAWPVGSGV